MLLRSMDKTARTNGRRPQDRLALEMLENRLLLAADVNTDVNGREPDIAVSPVDPSIIAVGSASDGTLRISTDYGATFGTTQVFQRPAGLED